MMEKKQQPKKPARKVAKKKAPAKNVGGRPTKYLGEVHDVAAMALARTGLTDEEISENLKIETRTFYRWKREHESFCQAVRAGKDSVDDRVENALLRRALGYRVTLVKEVAVAGPKDVGAKLEPAKLDVDYPPEVAAASMWLRNRRPDKWREKLDVEHSGSVTIVDDLPKGGKA